MNKILPSGANYNNRSAKKENCWWKYKHEDAEGNRVYVFDNGSKIFINYCDSESDLERYRGDEYDLILIDEETQFATNEIQFIRTTNRNSHILQMEDGTDALYPQTYWEGHPDVKKGKVKVGDPHPRAGQFVNYPSLLRTSCNPGNVGHKRVRDVVLGTQYGSKILVRRTKSIFEGRSDLLEKIVFIQGYLTDNPYLEDQYELQFRDLSPEKRLMELKGEWNVAGDNFFSNYDEDVHVIDSYRDLFTEQDHVDMALNPELEVPLSWEVYVFIDKGFHDVMPLHFWARTSSNDWVCFKQRNVRKLVVEQIADLLDKETTGMNLRMLVCPPDMYRRGNHYYNKEGEVVGETQIEYLNSRGYFTAMSNNNRVEGWAKCHSILYVERDEEGRPISKPKAFIDKSCVFLREGLKDTTRNPKNWDEISGDQPEDDVDTFRYMAMFWDIHIKKKIEQAEEKPSQCGVIYKRVLEKAGKVSSTKRRYPRPY